MSNGNIVKPYLRIECKFDSSEFRNWRYWQKTILMASEKTRKLDDKTLYELDSFLNNIFSNKNWIGLGITHSFSNTNLPITLNCLYKNENLTYEKVCDVNATVRSCFNYASVFHTDLWQGYSHLAIVEFENDIPPVFEQLPFYRSDKRWDIKLGLCYNSDWNELQPYFSKSAIKFDEFMRTHNPKIYEANKLEEANFKAAQAKAALPWWNRNL